MFGPPSAIPKKQAAMDISDAFDDIANYEEQLMAEGEELGMDTGRELGLEEGRALGLQKGAEIGEEVGFYQGCYLVWKQMEENKSARINERASKSIASFGALLQAYELENRLDEDLVQRLQLIRAKFKVITALLNVRNTLVFNQQDLDAHKNMSF